MDASFYATKRQISTLLEKSKVPSTALGTLCRFPRARTPAREDYVEKGIPVLKLKNIGSNSIDWEDLDFVPARISSYFFHPKRGDILITATGEGTVGRAALLTENRDCVVTGEIIVARPNARQINPYFLATYLNSKYGRPQLIRFVRGATGQTHLYAKDVEQLIVAQPKLEAQFKVETLLKEANLKLGQSDVEYSAVKSKLYDLADLEPPTRTGVRSYESKFSQFAESLRLDAEFYQPKYSALFKQLAKVKNVETLENVAARIVSGSYVDEYYPRGSLYLRVQNVRERELDLSDIEYVDVIRSAIPEKIRVKTGDVLLTRTGTTGVAFVATDELEGAVISQHLTRIVPNRRVDPLYLALCLNSDMCRLQMQRPLAGSLQKELTHDAMKAVLLPILSKATQEQLAKKFAGSLDLRKQGRALITEAELAIEGLVEKG